LGMTVVVLLLPKMLATALVLKDRVARRAFGGARMIAAGFVFEQLLSVLLAPVMMLFHSDFVLRALLGRSVAWNAQARGDRGISWREAWQRHRWHAAIGLAWGIAILMLAPHFIWWMSPVLAGMLLAMPFTVLTSRAELGVALRRHGWWLTPEETHAPPELAAAAAARAANRALSDLPLIDDGMQIVVPSRSPLPMVADPPAYLRMRPASRRRAVTST
ncbi:MAG: glucans biosynthesis glucosyltransferase MdoH, partial [Steroidobacteraceae bacterium]